MRPWSLPKAISEPEKLTAPMKAPAAASEVTTGPCVGRGGRIGRGHAEQLDRRDRGRGAAAHAVVERDHLRHVGHRDDAPRPPGEAAADRDRREHQREIPHAGIEEAHQRADQHAEAGDDDAAPRRDRRAHGLQAHDEEEGDQQVAEVDRERRDVVRYQALHQADSFFFFCPLALNIWSMRSVTT